VPKGKFDSEQPPFWIIKMRLWRKSSVERMAAVISASLSLSFLFVSTATGGPISSSSGSTGEPAPVSGAQESTSADLAYSGCPSPVLPPAAFFLSQYANLELTITATRDGSVQKVVISKKSRAQLYDEYTRKWVEKHWKMPPAKAGEPDLRKFIAPIVYPKGQPVPGGHFPDPDYPVTYIRNGIEGLVIIEMRIAPSGEIVDVRTIRSSGHRTLDEHTVRWVRKKWKFPPGEERLYHWPVAYVIGSG